MSELYWEVYQRLVDATDDLGDAAPLVEAALAGDDALVEALSSGAARAPAPPPAPPTRAQWWLRELVVEGFRGIGPRTTLQLEPGPGLTLVLGRNGAGKSSFSDALEVLFSGTAARWHDRDRSWQRGWRNLHADRTRVEATLDGPTPLTLRRVWEDGDETVPTPALTVSGSDDGIAHRLASALDSFRPVLATAELQRGLDKGPTRIFDGLQAILGVGLVSEAVARLRARRLEASNHRKTTRATAREILDLVDGSDDPRAPVLARELKRRRWDVDALAELATVDAGSPEAEQLRALAECPPLPLAELEAALAAVDEASEALAEAQTSSRAANEAVVAALDAALTWREHRGDGACVVCGGRTLDADWERDARERRDQARDAAAQLTRARQGLDDARQMIQRLVPPVPELPAGPLPTDALVDAWTRLAEAPTLEQTLEVEGLADALRGQAADALAARDAAWAPVARALSAWLPRAGGDAVLAAHEDRLKRAEAWLQGVEAELRDARFDPIAAEARALWSLLRQQSAVDLDDVLLVGRGNRRRLELAVSMEGATSVALGVMSQGELNALSLSLFLPRALLPTNPFRFLVIDDPVQSMDPHKVEGFARALEGIAATRQVIVFSHDPRLQEALWRLGVRARVLHLSRHASSRVALEEVREPVAQHLAEARQVLRSEVPEAVAARVVPGMCRAAAEAAAARVLWRRRLAAGADAGDVEGLLRDNPRFRDRLALAVFDAADQDHRLHNWSRHAGVDQTIRALNDGAHRGHAGDLDDLVRATEALTRHLARQA